MAHSYTLVSAQIFFFRESVSDYFMKYSISHLLCLLSWLYFYCIALFLLLHIILYIYLFICHCLYASLKYKLKEGRNFVCLAHDSIPSTLNKQYIN